MVSHLSGEIEEHLHILEDLSPDWISKKLRGGEVLYRQVPSDILFVSSANIYTYFMEGIKY
jgi:hypothetical protein